MSMFCDFNNAEGNGTFRDVLEGKLALGLASHQSCSNS